MKHVAPHQSGQADTYMVYGTRPQTPPVAKPVGKPGVATDGLVSEKLINFLEEGLKDMLDAELQLLAALPALAEATQSTALVTVLEEHMALVEKEISRLHDMLEAAGFSQETHHRNAVMETHIYTMQRAIAKTIYGTPLRNAHLVSHLHKIARYQEAAYLSLLTIARILHYNGVVDLLQLSLTEKNEAGTLFAKIGTEVSPANFTHHTIDDVPYIKP